MVERRDAGSSHSQQYFPVRDRWFRKIDQLQLLVTIESFCSHCTHISSPFRRLRVRHYASVSDPRVSALGACTDEQLAEVASVRSGVDAAIDRQVGAVDE